VTQAEDRNNRTNALTEKRLNFACVKVLDVSLAIFSQSVPIVLHKGEESFQTVIEFHRLTLPFRLRNGITGLDRGSTLLRGAKRFAKGVRMM